MKVILIVYLFLDSDYKGRDFKETLL